MRARGFTSPPSSYSLRDSTALMRVCRGQASLMPAELLFRFDPDRNMARFYKIDVQPTLFGEWAMICEWGRVGQGGSVRSTP